MKRFLVVYRTSAGLENFGFFDAEDAEIAKTYARKQWNTTANLTAYFPDDLRDGWSFFL